MSLCASSVRRKRAKDEADDHGQNIPSLLNNCANSTRKGDEDMFRITGAVTNDLVAAEARNHKACHATY